MTNRGRVRWHHAPNSRRHKRSQMKVPAIDMQTRKRTVSRYSSLGNTERCSMPLISGLT